ncbi:hypothetical protein BH10ACT11_BH10ACT11_09870 [soil metagenome]
MNSTAKASGPIAVYGASGYTGKLIAAELAAAGVEFVLSGRNRAKLEAVAADVAGDVRVEAVALDDPAGLRRMLEPCSAVIACAGPFSIHGEPVVSAAAETGTHYLDTTGEQPFMRMVFDAYGPIAERSGAALVTAMGFDYVPGDMIASLTAEGMGDLDELELSYAVLGFGPTRGTAHSAVASIADADVEWRDGALVAADRKISRGRFTFSAPIGAQRMVRYPAGEHVTVPKHVSTSLVTTRLTAATTMPPKLSAGAPALMGGLQLALRSALIKRGFDSLIRRLPEGPKLEDRRSARFEIGCTARAGTLTRSGTIRGGDIYGMTARATVNGALLMSEPGFGLSGAVAPSQAFDPVSFLFGLSDFGVAYEVDPLPAATEVARAGPTKRPVAAPSATALPAFGSACPIRRRRRLGFRHRSTPRPATPSAKQSWSIAVMSARRGSSAATRHPTSSGSCAPSHMSARAVAWSCARQTAAACRPASAARAGRHWGSSRGGSCIRRARWSYSPSGPASPMRARASPLGARRRAGCGRR